MSYGEELPLETLSASGAPPRQRIKDAVAAAEVAEQLEDAYFDGPGQVNARVKKCLDGNPPWNESDLEEVGQSWRSNLNFRLLESDSAFAQVPYYSVFSEVPHYVTVKLDSTYGTPWQREDWQQAISEEHHQLMQEWKGFDYQMQLSIKNRVDFGIGPIYFPDKEDFRFRAARHNEVFLPQDSPINCEEWEVAVIVREENVTGIFSSIDNPRAKDAGWDPEVGKALIKNACDDAYNEGRDWEEWQRRIRHNDLAFGVKVPKIRLANVFVREFSGKISHYIVAYKDSIKSSSYLFQYRERFEHWGQILHLMHAEIADGYVGGVKGLCVKAFNFRDTQNRLKNAVVDAAFVGSQVLIQAETPEAEEALDIVPMGPYARLPQGVKYSQNPLGGILDKPLMVDRQMESDLARNLGAYRQNLTDSRGQAVTATEAEINYGMQQSISGQQHNLFVSQLDDLYEEQIKRLLRPISDQAGADSFNDWQKLVYRFQQRLIARGVPKEAFAKVIAVRSYRALGQGSKFFRNQIHEKILSVFPMLPENVRERHLRNYITGLASKEYLEAIWPSVELTARADDHLSKAVDEHAVILVGLVPLWTPTQDSVAHLRAHIPYAAGILQAAQQGQGDPVKALQIWQVLGPHIQETLGHIQTNVGIPTPYKVFNDIRQAEFKEFWNQFKMLSSGFDQLAQQTEEAVNAQAQQQAEQMAAAQQQGAGGPPMDPALQLKAQAVQADIQLKQMKAQSDLEIKAAKARQQMALADAKTASKIRSMNDKQSV